MKYYKVNENGADKYMHKSRMTLVYNELYTEKEKERYNIPEAFVDVVNVSKNNIYWFFGARFEQGHFING